MILTPVIKKNKDPTDFYNYRGITVKPVIGKVHEYCILDKLNLQNSSDLQFVKYRREEASLSNSLFYIKTITKFTHPFHF
jgi:hypothetical protein